MKKRITVICLAVCLAVVAITGASLAYLTDTDKADNAFTVGNVDIVLTENFSQYSKLLPAVGSAQAGTLKNGVEKEVFVTNTGSEAAYVRVHIAIPSILDEGDPTFDAGKNVLHFNFSDASVADGKWNWSKAIGGSHTGNWNYYETTIDNVRYNVYVVTYETALANGETTLDAMHQVYLDSKVTNEDIARINEELNDNWHMFVVAEGVQAAGFDDAYTALNTAFGTPGSDGYVNPWNK